MKPCVWSDSTAAFTYQAHTYTVKAQLQACSSRRSDFAATAGPRQHWLGFHAPRLLQLAEHDMMFGIHQAVGLISTQSLRVHYLSSYQSEHGTLARMGRQVLHSTCV